jgi:uncharacterized membrane protein
MAEMNFVTVLIGLVLIIYGVFTFIQRKKNPKSFAKLEAMKRFWGERNGYYVHVFGYTVLPVVVGLVILILGLIGGSIF